MQNGQHYLEELHGSLIKKAVLSTDSTQHSLVWMQILGPYRQPPRKTLYLIPQRTAPCLGPQYAWCGERQDPGWTPAQQVWISWTLFDIDSQTTIVNLLKCRQTDCHAGCWAHGYTQHVSSSAAEKSNKLWARIVEIL